MTSPARARLDGVMPAISLREVTRATVRRIVDLEVAEEQRNFVAPNAVSIAEAYFEPKAWFRAIYADEEPVGFIMLFDDAEEGRYYLWRMMIAAAHQGKGYGRAALDLLVDYVRTRPEAAELLVSSVPGDGSPQPFYEGYGFAATGEIHGDEVVLRLGL